MSITESNIHQMHFSTIFYLRSAHISAGLLIFNCTQLHSMALHSTFVTEVFRDGNIRSNLHLHVGELCVRNNIINESYETQNL